MHSFHVLPKRTAQAGANIPAGRTGGRRGEGGAPPCTEAPVGVSHCSAFYTTTLSCKGGGESGLRLQDAVCSAEIPSLDSPVTEREGSVGAPGGPTQTCSPGRLSSLLSTHCWACFSASFRHGPGHGPRCPALLRPNAAACSFIPYSATFDAPCSNQK